MPGLKLARLLAPLLAAVSVAAAAAPAHAANRFYTAPHNITPREITVASDGALWMTGEDSSRYDDATLWHFTPASGFHKVALPAGLTVNQLLPGPEGGLRFFGFADDETSVVGSVDAGGRLTTAPTSLDVVSAVEAPDGGLWGLGHATNPLGPWRLVRTSPDGTQTAIALPRATERAKKIQSVPRNVVIAGGALWFMHPRGGTLVRATTDGSFRQYRLDRVCPRHHWCLVHSLAAGSGGGAAVTMTPDEFSHGQLVRVSPTGELTSRTLPAFGFCAIPGALASGPHGTVWTSAFGNGCAVVGRANAGGGASWLWRSRGRVWDLAVAGRWLWAATDLGLARFDTRHSSKPKPSAPSGGGGR